MESTVLYCTVLYCTALYCTVLYCTVLYCTVLYCIVLYFTRQHYLPSMAISVLLDINSNLLIQIFMNIMIILAAHFISSSRSFKELLNTWDSLLPFLHPLLFNRFVFWCCTLVAVHALWSDLALSKLILYCIVLHCIILYCIIISLSTYCYLIPCYLILLLLNPYPIIFIHLIPSRFNLLHPYHINPCCSLPTAITWAPTMSPWWGSWVIPQMRLRQQYTKALLSTPHSTR